MSEAMEKAENWLASKSRDGASLWKHLDGTYRNEELWCQLLQTSLKASRNSLAFKEGKRKRQNWITEETLELKEQEELIGSNGSEKICQWNKKEVCQCETEELERKGEDTQNLETPQVSRAMYYKVRASTKERLPF